MIQGKWFSQGSDISVPLHLRKLIFNADRDPIDDWAQQVVIYHHNEPVGTARLWWAEGSFQISHAGVLENERGKGYGDLLLRLLLFKAQSHHAARVELTAPFSAIPFFSRYGFVSLEDLPSAEQRMGISGEAIVLSHCGGHCDGRCEDCTPT